MEFSIRGSITIVIVVGIVVAACQARCTSPEGATSPDQQEVSISAEERLPSEPDVEAPLERKDSVSRGKPKPQWIDSELMSALEERGLSLNERLGMAHDEASLAQLSGHSPFADIADRLEADLQEFKEADPQLGVGVAGFSHRLFDPSWLRSNDTFFELVGLVSRIDRRPFVDDACGEVRLVYRLAYETDQGDDTVASRLPMTLAVDWLEEAPREGGCGHVVRRWQMPDGLDEDARISWLVGDDGPATLARLEAGSIHRVQINLQSVRWPSTVQPSMAGHAEYVLRSFAPNEEGRLEPEGLENTPDVERLADDAMLREELLEWIKAPDNLRRIDKGTARLPERFLARRAISVAPRGLARRANRPFDEVFEQSAFEELDFDDLEQVRSGPGLLRRLDDKSCAGCHQGRAVAGFHLLGEDPEGTFYANALASSNSAHSADEIVRRRVLMSEELAGDDVSYGRPFSERNMEGSGAYGTPCGLTDDATFARWDCADGLTCQPYDLPTEQQYIGICLPVEPAVGDPCEVGRVRSHRDPHRDRVVEVEKRDCGPHMVCNTNRVGFPGGMCTSSCSNPGPDGRCGAIAVLHPFNQCLAAERPFEECLSEHVSPAGLRSCDDTNPCRHDYLCARNADGEGTCIPPYFLFQMRVDGHP